MYFNGNAAFELFLGAIVQIAPIALGDQIGKIDRIAHETMDYMYFTSQRAYFMTRGYAGK